MSICTERYYRWNINTSLLCLSQNIEITFYADSPDFLDEPDFVGVNILNLMWSLFQTASRDPSMLMLRIKKVMLMKRRFSGARLIKFYG